MGAITVGPELVTLLSPLKETTEICDVRGQVLGIFTPATVTAEPGKVPFDLEEAERVLATERNAGRPLEEIWRELRSQRTPE